MKILKINITKKTDTMVTFNIRLLDNSIRGQFLTNNPIAVLEDGTLVCSVNHPEYVESDGKKVIYINGTMETADHIKISVPMSTFLLFRRKFDNIINFEKL